MEKQHEVIDIALEAVCLLWLNFPDTVGTKEVVNKIVASKKRLSTKSLGLVLQTLAATLSKFQLQD